MSVKDEVKDINVDGGVELSGHKSFLIWDIPFSYLQAEVCSFI